MVCLEEPLGGQCVVEGARVPAPFELRRGSKTSLRHIVWNPWATSQEPIRAAFEILLAQPRHATELRCGAPGWFWQRFRGHGGEGGLSHCCPSEGGRRIPLGSQADFDACAAQQLCAGCGCSSTGAGRSLVAWLPDAGYCRAACRPQSLRSCRLRRRR